MRNISLQYSGGTSIVCYTEGTLLTLCITTSDAPQHLDKSDRMKEQRGGSNGRAVFFTCWPCTEVEANINNC